MENPPPGYGEGVMVVCEGAEVILSVTGTFKMCRLISLIELLKQGIAQT